MVYVEKQKDSSEEEVERLSRRVRQPEVSGNSKRIEI
jgi:predicted transcriptional regulator